MTDVHTDAVQREARRKRVQRLKKIIVATLITAILLPTVFCIFLLIKTAKLEQQIETLTEQIAFQEEKMQEVTMNTEPENTEPEVFLAEPEREPEPEKMTVDEPLETVSGNESGEPIKIRNVYLTFDDGPSIYTGEILDILKEYDVKATFFVTGKEGQEAQALYRRIVEEGHTLGMHSYSHKYDEIYASKESFEADFVKLRDYLYEVTGVECKLYRFPGGSSNMVSQVDMGELIEFLEEQEITYFDWNVSSGDSSGNELSVKQIVDNCTENMDYYNNAFILMHDSKEKRTTVEALPFVIEKILAFENTQIVPITDDTVPVQQIKN